MNDFFAGIYEKFYYSIPFSDDLYQENMYGPLGIIAVTGALVMMAVFYYFINRPSFSRWYHWLMILAIHFTVQFGICMVQTKPKLQELNPDYSGQFWTFAFMHAVIATLLYIIFSFAFRWWSKNCKQTPIPN